MKQIIGRKIGMTQVFASDGTQYAVSVINILPNVVTRVKSKEKDGYDALVVGFDSKKESNANKSEKGIAKKANLPVAKFLREVSGNEVEKLNLKVGDKLDASLFKAGDVVDVIGTSKGKGYTGTIKRYHHTIGPKGHGSGYHRGVGSFANNGRCNNRVLPGKKMSGHFGFNQVTIQNLIVVESNAEKNYILIKGAVPGCKQSLVKIRSAVKTQLGKPETIKNLAVYAKKEEKVEPKAEVKQEAKVEAKPNEEKKGE